MSTTIIANSRPPLSTQSRCYGEVYIGLYEKVILRCCICPQEYLLYDDFAAHIFEHHFETLNRNSETKQEEVPFEQEIETLNQSRPPERDDLSELNPLDEPIIDVATLKVPLCADMRSRRYTAEKRALAHQKTTKKRVSQKTPPTTTTNVPIEQQTIASAQSPPNRPVEWYKCDICPIVVRSKISLRRHKRRHEGVGTKECDFCQKRFYTNNELLIHKRRHTGERPFVCKECGASFTSASWRNRHEREHENRLLDIRNHKCDHCGKTFREPIHLRSHLMGHAEERKYACTQCDKRFKRSKELYEHKKLHENARAYVCNVCGKGFNQSTARMLHMRNKHKVVMAPVPVQGGQLKGIDGIEEDDDEKEEQQNERSSEGVVGRPSEDWGGSNHV